MSLGHDAAGARDGSAGKAGSNGTGVVIGGSCIYISYYINNYNYNFQPASDITGYSLVGFSMGVNGHSVASVPEPSTLVMGVIGTLTMLGYAWHRRRLRA
jgi:PEP-CTERM motif